MFSNLQNRGLSFPSLPLSNSQARTNTYATECWEYLHLVYFYFLEVPCRFPRFTQRGLVVGAGNNAFTSPQNRPQHGASMWAPGETHLCAMGFSKDNPVVWALTTLSGWQCPLKPRMAAAGLEPPS